MSGFGCARGTPFEVSSASVGQSKQKAKKGSDGRSDHDSWEDFFERGAAAVKCLGTTVELETEGQKSWVCDLCGCERDMASSLACLRRVDAMLGTLSRS